MTLSNAERDSARWLIDAALSEDLGTAGDRTTLSLIDANQQGTATFVARSPGILAGMPVVMEVLSKVDRLLRAKFAKSDGDAVAAKDVIGTVEGPLQSILIAERTALNFLQQLSGIATYTGEFVNAIRGTNAKILDTRKTTPGWRLLEKYAVRCGGGVNHRIGLHDAILIKDNHIAGVHGDVVAAVNKARNYPGNKGLPVEIEVDSIVQLEKVLGVKPEIVLLDNMSLNDLKMAVNLRNALAPQTLLEASGGVNLKTVRGIAEAGVDRISVGAITHSAPALDIALDIPA